MVYNLYLNHFVLFKATLNELKSPLKRASIHITNCFTLGNKDIYSIYVYIFNICEVLFDQVWHLICSENSPPV